MNTKKYYNHETYPAWNEKEEDIIYATPKDYEVVEFAKAISIYKYDIKQVENRRIKMNEKKALDKNNRGQ